MGRRRCQCYRLSRLCAHGNAVGGIFFAETYGLSDIAANYLLVWTKLALLLVLLPAGFLLDMRVISFHAALITGIVMVLLAWLLLSTANALIPPAFPAVLAGMGFAIANTASQPLLYLRLDPASAGRVLGFFFMLMQASLVINSLAVGALRDRTATLQGSSSSITALYFLAAVEALALALAIVLTALDGCQEPTRVSVSDATPAAAGDGGRKGV